MKLHFTAAVAALAIALSAPAFAESRIIDATGFTGIDISTGIKAVVTIGETYSVRVDSPRASDFDQLRVFVDGGTLHARYDWDLFHLLDFSGRDVTVTVTLPRLEMVDASSGSSLRADGVGAPSLHIDASSGAHVDIRGANAQSYDLDASSGSEIVVAGSCGTVEADASSGSHISTKALACTDGSADVSSGAGVDLAVAENLSVDASSGGQVTVTGRPRVKTLDTSSGGHVAFVD